MKISSKLNPYMKTGVFVVLASILVFSFSFASNMFARAAGPVANDDTIVVNSFQIPIEIEIAELLSNDEDMTGFNFYVTDVSNGSVDVDIDNGIVWFYPDNPSSLMGFGYQMLADGEVEPDVYRFGDHYYQFVNASLSWGDAFDAATNATLDVDSGTLTDGYLVEINSLEEDLFLRRHISQSAWTGGNDIYKEGVWVWSNSGVQFWQGFGPRYSGPEGPGHGFDGVYNYWQGVEPNDYAPGEDCLMIDYGWYSGEWNDIACGEFANYIIEYEDLTAEPVDASNEAWVNISVLTGDFDCTVNGVTAYWTGTVLDVWCGDYEIVNIGASEIILTGEANDYFDFENYFDGFTTLNLDNLTENKTFGDVTCNRGSGNGCVSLMIYASDKVDLNVIGDNQVQVISSNIYELNLVGSGSLNLLDLYSFGDDRETNLNTNINILATTNWGVPVITGEGNTINIVGGNLTISGDAKIDWETSAILAENINISNGANIVIDLNNNENYSNRDMPVFKAINSITFGDKLVAIRDGNVLADINNLDNYLIKLGESAYITFGAPSDGTGDDLTAPNTGYSRK